MDIAVLVGMAIPLFSILVLGVFVSRNIVRVPPDMALVLSGRKRAEIDPTSGQSKMMGYRVIVGGSAFKVPVLERADRLPLAEMSIRSDLVGLVGSAGRSASISFVVNCRISSFGEAMNRAISRFLSMDLDDIEQITRTTIESRIMDLFPTIDVSDAVAWPEHVLVLETAIRADLDAMGIAVDNVIFRGPPTVSTPSAMVNGHRAGRTR